MVISNISKEGTKVWNENHGDGILFARSISDDEVFLVRFQQGHCWIHRKQLSKVVEK